MELKDKVQESARALGLRQIGVITPAHTTNVYLQYSIEGNYYQVEIVPEEVLERYNHRITPESLADYIQLKLDAGDVKDVSVIKKQ